jgi:DNA-binding Lrp family transcriptional regulator
MSQLSATERAVLREILAGIPPGVRPYATIGSRVGLAEDDVLASIRSLADRGIVRRLAAVLNDGKLGYGGNAMVVWRVPDESSSDALDDALDRAGSAAAAREVTSHVYARRATRGWPYNLYTMVHARSREAVAALVGELRPLIGATDHRVLFTLHEFTKRPPCYPCLARAGQTPASADREVPEPRGQEK